MNRIILNLQEELNKDIILKDFYNNNLSKIINKTFNEYIEKKYIEFSDELSNDKINKLKQSLGIRIRTNKSRLNSELEVHYPKKTRTIEFHNLLNKKLISIKNNFDNELLMSIIKNEISYIPIKGLNTRSLKFIDKVMYDYTKTMFSKDREDYIEYRLRDLAKFLYPNNNIAMGEKLARKLITKIGDMRYKIQNPNSENIKDTVTFSIIDPEWNTNEKDETYCTIYISGFIIKEIKNKRTTKLYKEKYNLIKNDFTLIFVNFIQRKRIFDLQMLKTENIFGYEKLNEGTRLPYKNRKRNMEAVKNSLQELKDLNFLIKDFKANDFYIEVEYLPFTNKELTELNIEDKKLLKC